MARRPRDPSTLTEKQRKQQEYRRKYHEEHREEIKAYKKQYYEEHREEKKAYDKKYYEEHREEVNARRRAGQQQKKAQPEIQEADNSWVDRVFATANREHSQITALEQVGKDNADADLDAATVQNNLKRATNFTQREETRQGNKGSLAFLLN